MLLLLLQRQQLATKAHGATADRHKDTKSRVYSWFWCCNLGGPFHLSARTTGRTLKAGWP